MFILHNVSFFLCRDLNVEILDKYVKLLGDFGVSNVFGKRHSYDIQQGNKQANKQTNKQTDRQTLTDRQPNERKNSVDDGMYTSYFYDYENSAHF